tara:strand:- start:1679 stop:2176 length:498 start_codon:yes stop_codon:yes gene_type:complete
MNIQCILIGDSGTGKTSLSQSQQSKPLPTIGIELINYHHHNLNLNIWDSSGLPNFKTLIHVFEKQCNTIVYVFAADNPKSFESICEWHKQLKTEEKIFFCICNKIDLASADPFRIQIEHRFPEIRFIESSINIRNNRETILHNIISHSEIIENRTKTIDGCCILQ